MKRYKCNLNFITCKVQLVFKEFLTSLTENAKHVECRAV
jgi:hypothetical protein